MKKDDKNEDEKALVEARKETSLTNDFKFHASEFVTSISKTLS